MWDLLAELYKRLGGWALLGTGVMLATVWAISHLIAEPCEQVSVFGLIEYTKACRENGRGSGQACESLRHDLGRNAEKQADLRRDIMRHESAVARGDRGAQTGLEMALQRLGDLEREGREIEGQMQRQCQGTAH
jgi:hypothetical protein